MVHLVLVLFLVSLGTFSLIELVPGDPAIAVLGPQATPERHERVIAELGLDQPFHERYFDWIGSAVQGDLGNSLVPPAQSVATLAAPRAIVTVELAVVAIAIALLVAIPLGVLSAYREGTPFDRLGQLFTSATVSLPSFVTSLLLIFFAVFHPSILQAALIVGTLSLVAGLLLSRFRARRLGRGATEADPTAGRRGRTQFKGTTVAGIVLGIVAVILIFKFPDFPRQGYTRWSDSPVRNLRSVFLPSLALSLPQIAIFTRVLRADMLNVLQQDYILMSRAKGLPSWRTLLIDGFKPASLSLLTLSGVSLGLLIGGSVIVETVFSLPGMGTLLIQSILSSDFPVVQGLVLLIAAAYVTINTTVDVLHRLLDPRVRYAA